jgi:putative transposase
VHTTLTVNGREYAIDGLYGGMDLDAAKELKELREQNTRLKRLLAEAELEKDALRDVAKDAIITEKF